MKTENLKKIGERELPSLCWWEDPTVVEVFEDENGKIWEKFSSQTFSPLGQEDNDNGNN